MMVTLHSALCSGDRRYIAAIQVTIKKNVRRKSKSRWEE